MFRFEPLKFKTAKKSNNFHIYFDLLIDILLQGKKGNNLENGFFNHQNIVKSKLSSHSD